MSKKGDFKNKNLNITLKSINDAGKEEAYAIKEDVDETDIKKALSTDFKVGKALRDRVAGEKKYDGDKEEAHAMSLKADFKTGRDLKDRVAGEKLDDVDKEMAYDSILNKGGDCDGGDCDIVEKTNGRADYGHIVFSAKKKQSNWIEIQNKISPNNISYGQTRSNKNQVLFTGNPETGMAYTDEELKGGVVQDVVGKKSTVDNNEWIEIQNVDSEEVKMSTEDDE